MVKRYKVEITKFAQKQILKMPHHIQRALRTWVEIIDEEGILVMRQIPGYHDEPLKGQRAGERSSRLSKAYRVIYEEIESELTIVSVLEVNKHEY